MNAVDGREPALPEIARRQQVGRSPIGDEGALAVRSHEDADPPGGQAGSPDGPD